MRCIAAAAAIARDPCSSQWRSCRRLAILMSDMLVPGDHKSEDEMIRRSTVGMVPDEAL